jgi:ElaB/YqjD/DUF883 family membrane-anchored ribosome-binding protein
MENNDVEISDKEKMKKAELRGVEDTLYKTEDEYENLSEKTSKVLKSIGEKANSAYRYTKEKPEELKEATVKYVRAHPEKSLLIAAGIGALTALIAVGLTRRRRD